MLTLYYLPFDTLKIFEFRGAGNSDGPHGESQGNAIGKKLSFSLPTCKEQAGALRRSKPDAGPGQALAPVEEAASLSGNCLSGGISEVPEWSLLSGT